MKISLDISDKIVLEIVKGARISYWASRYRLEPGTDRLYITERDDEKLIVVKTRNLINALELMAIKAPKQFGSVLADNASGRAYSDGTIGDTLLQLACFGEIKYA